jgi:hypothetical protein
MKAKAFLPKFGLVFVSMFLLASCRLPGMIPLTPIPTVPMPVMEKDGAAHLEKLKGTDWVYLQSLAEEKYTEADFAKPGTLTFTVKITDDTPTYFDYAWCATSEEILKQNFEHISVSLYFNEEELGADVVHPVSFTRSDGLVCLDIGVLMSDWPTGNYKLESAVRFDEKINDGLDDYEAGDYIHLYNVMVEK